MDSDVPNAEGEVDLLERLMFYAKKRLQVERQLAEGILMTNEELLPPDRAFALLQMLADSAARELPLGFRIEMRLIPDNAYRQMSSVSVPGRKVLFDGVSPGVPEI